MQAAGGAGGEFLAQTVTKDDQPYDWFDIAMEAAAEIATGPAEVFSNVRESVDFRSEDGNVEKGLGTARETGALRASAQYPLRSSLGDRTV